MFFVPRTNAVDHFLRLQQIFLAQEFVLLLVGRIRAQNLTHDTFTAVFIYPTRHRIHLQQHARLVVALRPSVAERHKKQTYGHHLADSHSTPFPPLTVSHSRRRLWPWDTNNAK